MNHWVSLHDVWGSTTFVSYAVNERSHRVSVSCYSSNTFPGTGAPLKWFENLLFAGLEFEDLFGMNVYFCFISENGAKCSCSSRMEART